MLDGINNIRSGYPMGKSIVSYRHVKPIAVVRQGEKAIFQFMEKGLMEAEGFFAFSMKTKFRYHKT